MAFILFEELKILYHFSTAALYSVPSSSPEHDLVPNRVTGLVMEPLHLTTMHMNVFAVDAAIVIILG